MQPKVSIVIPSLNSINYIDECLQSVINQTLKDIEIICVDANSTDGTLEYLKDLEKKDHRVKVIVSDKKSYGYQMNLGINAAKGEYLGIVESDDYIKLNMYERLYKVAKEQDCEVLKCDLENFWGNRDNKVFDYGPISYRDDLYGRLFDKKILEATEPNLIIPLIKDTWNMNPPGLYRLDFINKFNIRFNETPGASYQDLSFWFMMQALAQKIYFLNEAYYYYRQDNENSSCNSVTKVYCLCDEYDFMVNFLNKYPELSKTFIYLLSYLRFGSYNWNLNRIADEFKLEFLLRLQKDFKEIIENNTLDRNYFYQQQLEQLDKIVSDPWQYYIDTYQKPLGAVNRIKNQLSYKLGNKIVKAKTPTEIIKLPFSLVSIINEHKFEKNVLSILYKINPSFKPLPLESYGDYYVALKYKEHLSYKLGQALVKNPFTFIFKIPSIYKNFKGNG
jgi:glycosyltransferase involved in cell wall biosynthesis